jgi:hypothetical protein
MLISSRIGGVAKDLARIVDCHGVRKREASTGGNQRVQIDQAVRSSYERNVLAGLWRMVLRLGEDCIEVPVFCSKPVIHFCSLKGPCPKCFRSRK